MIDEISEEGAGQHQPMRRGALGAWWWQGFRTAAFLKADWRMLQATPGVVACLVIVPCLVDVLVERLYIVGPATFHWPSMLSGWLTTLLVLWACWLLMPRTFANAEGEPHSAVALFAMLSAQSLTITVVSTLIFLPMVRSGSFSSAYSGKWSWWTAWTIAVAWYAFAQLVLAWRSTTARGTPRAIALLLLIGSTAMVVSGRPDRRWYPVAAQEAKASAPAPLKLTQELLELQPQLLKSRLQAITAGRAGVVDMYAITFSPYADEDVFGRESQLVASVMQERFGALGKTIQLVNHNNTIREWPWATPLNLQRSIQRMAEVMNRDEDVLFIHLTSHGARNGELAAEFWPLEVDPVTPTMLKGWLDKAGIRYRVISVSACFSGSWIEPLADPGTLVMTAADANHTSYGCGKGSILTYFGRAMFDEQLRHTPSFEKAHAAARRMIDQREREAGKTDGYSNPQIRIGDAIRERLARMEAERAKYGR